MNTIQRRVVSHGVERIEETNVQWRRYVGPWGVLMQLSGEGIAELSARLADKSLGMQAIRVLFACMSSANRENEVRAGRKDLSQELGMAESNVHKALQALVECGFLEKPKLRYSPYVISPRFFWRSTNAELKQALASRGMLDQRGMMKAKDAA